MAAASVAVAAVIAAAVAFGSAPGADTPPASAEVVARIHRATQDAAADMILHGVFNDPGLGRTELWYDPVTTASRLRMETSAGQPKDDFGWPEPPGMHDRRAAGPRLAAACLPFTLDAPGRHLRSQPCPPVATSPHAQRAVSYCTRTYTESGPGQVSDPVLIEVMVPSDRWVLAGIRVVDGRRLISLRSHQLEMLVDPDTYLPVRVGVRRSPDQGFAEIISYEWFTRTPQHLALLSPPIPDGFQRTANTAACAPHGA